MHTSEDKIGESSRERAFLAMPVVYGPSEVKFYPDRPATLRFFAGYFDDPKKEIQEDSGVNHTRTFGVGQSLFPRSLARSRFYSTTASGHCAAYLRQFSPSTSNNI